MLPEKIGKYSIIRELGRGGMGTVYEGFDASLDRRVAIKVLHAHFKGMPEIAERFLNEARAANRIGHLGVVQVSECNTLEDGTAYMVMEYLDGETLTVRLREHDGRLPLWMALNIASQIAETLHWGHNKGIIHRDLKPDNIMIIVDSIAPCGERCKLLDFGIAKNTQNLSKQNSTTKAHEILGTPGYMAPEQLRGAGFVTIQSDVYLFGSILFEMLAGRRPFVADYEVDLNAMLVRDEAPAITEFVTDVPDALVRLLKHMLSTKASDRPDMASVLETLTEIKLEVPVPTSGRLAARRTPTAENKDENAEAKARFNDIPQTFVPGKPPKKSDEPTLANDPGDKHPPAPRSANSNNSLVNGKRKSLFAVMERMGDKRASAIAGAVMTILACGVVYWGMSTKVAMGLVVALDMDGEMDASENPKPDLRGLDDLSRPPDLRTPADTAPPDMPEPSPPTRQCPPIFTAACIRGKNLTSAQKNSLRSSSIIRSFFYVRGRH